MANFNKVILIGNITRDIDVRYTPSGKAISKFSLAVNRVWTTDAGEKKEETTFVDIDSFGKAAENLAKYAGKGSPLMVEGRLKLDKWNDKTTGEARQRLGVVLESFQLLGWHRDKASAEGETPSAEPPVSPAPAPAAGEPVSDNVPF